MREDDLVAGLTRQVKEEVLENYIAERRLIEIQTEELNRLADLVRHKARRTGQRLTRLAFLLVHPDHVERFRRILGMPPDSPWAPCLCNEFACDIRFLRVRALTGGSRYRKLLLEAYSRLFRRMSEYRKSYEDLCAECRGVNMNITTFSRNFDILSIMSFLRGLDVEGMERKHFLGDNFTGCEVASIEKQLLVHPVDFGKLDVPFPLLLPAPETVSTALADLAADVYRQCPAQVKRILR